MSGEMQVSKRTIVLLAVAVFVMGFLGVMAGTKYIEWRQNKWKEKRLAGLATGQSSKLRAGEKIPEIPLIGLDGVPTSTRAITDKNNSLYLFVSVGVIDSSHFKGVAEIEALKKQTIDDLQKYVDFAHHLGFRAQMRYAIGREAVEQVVELCEKIRDEFPRAIFYLGQLVFENDKFYYRLLHNETAFAIQRRLQFAGLQSIVLPIRVLKADRKRGLRKAS